MSAYSNGKLDHTTRKCNCTHRSNFFNFFIHTFNLINFFFKLVAQMFAVTTKYFVSSSFCNLTTLVNLFIPGFVFSHNYFNSPALLNQVMLNSFSVPNKYHVSFETGCHSWRL